MKSPKRKDDPLFNIKYFAYHMAMYAKGGSMKDLVRFAKFQLSHKSGRLMKDPIWDLYTPEEILVEFFAHRFTADKDLRGQFEALIGMGDEAIDDFAAWADKEIKKNQEERKNNMGEVQDRVEFTPDIIGD